MEKSAACQNTVRNLGMGNVTVRAGRPAAVADHGTGVDAVDVPGIEPVLPIGVEHRQVMGRARSPAFLIPARPLQVAPHP
jgi:hypothetical protein